MSANCHELRRGNGRARNAATRSSAVRARASLIVALASVGVLGGCREHDVRLDNATAITLSDPAKRHAIAMADRGEALYVEVPDDGQGLSDNQATDVVRFVDRYKSEAKGPLRISAPASVRGHLAISRSFRDIEELVDRSGVPDEAVQRSRTRSADKFGHAVKLSYERPVAVPPACGAWPDDVGRIDRERLPTENFGCSTQRNLALTVANARDLEVPQEETPRASEVRSGSWSKYAAGGKPAQGGAPASSGGKPSKNATGGP